ncbi:uncharacterized protein L203_102163 [Cryptococcus depauperatus CBS 7841]|uniref:Cation/H+ exchanger transmembrane domain-containing protein n=1 Tax=Cryptococcus depauperatus CBS 7841 TaxID=1295531 RepID=A0AAJ8JRA2_9TREE
MQQVTGAAASSPYHEPGMSSVLWPTRASLFGCRLGDARWKWLGVEAEHAVVQLGYLGLLLLVYDGGLSTSLSSLKANIYLSIGVATAEIGLPMGLSFILRDLIHATSIQCFAAGAALCSTSLGTTFTVLGSSGLCTDDSSSPPRRLSAFRFR